MFISKEEFQQLWDADGIADARQGGLVIGRSHAEGNIYMIRQYTNIDAYEDYSNMEGGEYIINHEAYLLHKDRIEYINSFLIKEYNVDMEEVCRTPLILTQRLDRDKDKLLLIDNRGQFIVNKHAACKFLKELNEINQSGLTNRGNLEHTKMNEQKSRAKLFKLSWCILAMIIGAVVDSLAGNPIGKLIHKLIE